jgi:hypothetical protein
MNYPTTIPAWREALFAYTPAETPENADLWASVEQAQRVRSTVVSLVEFFNAAKSHPDLDADGLRLLVGAAHLIAENGFHDLGGEAAVVLATRAGDVPEPAPVDPIGEGLL